jgi:hypothetical protein
VYAAQGSNRQRRIQRGRQTFAGNIAQVQTNTSVRQLEIIQKIATHRGNGLEFVRDHHRSGAQ